MDFDKIFEPCTEPSLTLYKALEAECRLRCGRDFKTWLSAECHAMLNAAWKYADAHGLRRPTLEEVMRQEKLAYGFADYAAKWAYGVAKLMEK